MSGSTVLHDLDRFGPARCECVSAAGAARYAEGVARRGRENFHVLSRLLPRHLRGDVANLYAYCRWADDLADETCTALQLVNFWQDVRRDILERDRVYLPRDVAAEHDLAPDELSAAVKSDEEAACDRVDAAFRSTVRELIDRTRPLFVRGRQLLPLLDPAVRRPVFLFTLGGEATLRKIVGADYSTHRHRPRLNRLEKAVLLARAWLPGAAAPLEATA